MIETIEVDCSYRTKQQLKKAREVKNDTEFSSLAYFRLVKPLKSMRKSEGKTDMEEKAGRLYVRH